MRLSHDEPPFSVLLIRHETSLALTFEFFISIIIVLGSVYLSPYNSSYFSITL